MVGCEIYCVSANLDVWNFRVCFGALQIVWRLDVSVWGRGIIRDYGCSL